MGHDLHWTQQQYDEYLRKHNLPPRIPPDVDVIQHPESKLRHAKTPNKTEAEYGRILEAMKLRGEIIRYEYEGITFRWLDMRYTPDWIVVFQLADDFTHRFKAIEVKGAHIFDRDIVRFKGARALWPEIQFELHQKKAGGWTRLF